MGAIEVTPGGTIIFERATYPDTNIPESDPPVRNPLWKGLTDPNGVLTEEIGWDVETHQAAVLKSSLEMCAESTVRRVQPPALLVECNLGLQRFGSPQGSSLGEGFLIDDRTTVVPSDIGGTQGIDQGDHVRVTYTYVVHGEGDIITPYATKIEVIRDAVTPVPSAAATPAPAATRAPTPSGAAVTPYAGGRLLGKVVDALGRPAAGVELLALRCSSQDAPIQSGPREASATTGPSGEFELRGLMGWDSDMPNLDNCYDLVLAPGQSYVGLTLLGQPDPPDFYVFTHIIRFTAYAGVIRSGTFQVLARVRLIEPAENSTVVGPVVRFAWEAIDGATVYKLRWRSGAGAAFPTHELETTATTLELHSPMTDVQHCWEVHAFSGSTLVATSLEQDRRVTGVKDGAQCFNVVSPAGVR